MDLQKQADTDLLVSFQTVAMKQASSKTQQLLSNCVSGKQKEFC